MSAQLYALGRWCFRNARRVLLIWLAIALVLGALGFGIMGRFNDNFEIPGSSSQAALERLHMTFPQGSALTATAVVTAPEGTDVNDLQDEVEAGLSILEAPEAVDTAQSPWFEYIDGMISHDNSAALINLTLNVSETPNDAQLAEITAAGEELEQTLPAGTELVMGGQAYSIELPTVSPTEIVGLVLSFIVLMIMLGSAMAAIVPIVTAVLGVALTMAMLLAATGLMEVNSTVPMLAAMLGLAVGIDYALFIFSRHRDQLRAGMELEDSIGRAIGTAGTAIVFAGATNAIALTGLAVAGIPFLTVMGIFASVAVIVAVVIALTLLPAFAAFLGERMRPKAKKERRAAEGEPARATRVSPGKRLFEWWVGVTTSHPIKTIVAVTVALGALSAPTLNLVLSLPNAGQMNKAETARHAYDLIGDHFGPGYNATLVVTGGIVESTDPMGLIEDLRAEVEAVEGVEQVMTAVPNMNADTALIQLAPTTASDDPATIETVERLRAVTDSWEEKYGVEADVTGFTAVQMDVTQKLGAAVFPFVILVVGLSLILLAAVFRSVWVPIKTAVGFLLSVGASFGLTQLVFNEGFLKELINLEQPVAIISFLPILLIAILFGLAMDYEIFIVSRIREEYMHGKSAIDAIRDGFVASGPVVTAAAIVMFAVFAFFVPQGMMAIKTIAFALAVGVAFDAFLIRMTFVPAVLALLGDKAWWIPKWLDKALPEFDMEGHVLTTKLGLADWPGTEAIAHVEEIAIDGLLDPLSLRAMPGEVIGLVAPAQTRAAAALAITGRLTTDSGRARVCGGLLPEDSGPVRRRTRYIDLAHVPDVAVALDAAKPKDRGLVVVDGVELVGTVAEREAFQRLAERARTENFAVIVCAGSESAFTLVTPDDVVRAEAHEGSLV